MREPPWQRRARAALTYASQVHLSSRWIALTEMTRTLAKSRRSLSKIVFAHPCGFNARETRDEFASETLHRREFLRPSVAAIFANARTAKRLRLPNAFPRPTVQWGFCKVWDRIRKAILLVFGPLPPKWGQQTCYFERQGNLTWFRSSAPFLLCWLLFESNRNLSAACGVTTTCGLGMTSLPAGSRSGRFG